MYIYIFMWQFEIYFEVCISYFIGVHLHTFYFGGMYNTPKMVCSVQGGISYQKKSVMHSFVLTVQLHL